MASPRSTCSILITSAPQSASSADAAGTKVCSATSRMRTPCITSVMTAPPVLRRRVGTATGGRGVMVTDGIDDAGTVAHDVVHQRHELVDLDEAAVHEVALDPDRTELDGEVGVPLVGELRHRLALAAEQSPTVTRVKPTSGCSVRHASTIRSSAALLTR